MQTGIERILFTLSGIALLATGVALAGENVSIPSGGHHEGLLEARNNPIEIGDDATVEGDVENRNGRIVAGKSVTAGNISARNGYIKLGMNGRFGDVSSRNGAINLGDNSQAGNIDSRNGSIEIGGGSRIGAVESRNGSMSLRDDIEVMGNLQSRNGAIRGGTGLRVSGDVSSRNGMVKLATGSEIDGDITTRNGRIELTGTSTARHLQSNSGDLILQDGSRTGGDVVIEMDEDSAGHSGGFLWFGGRRSYPDAGDIRILGSSEVGGDVVLLLPADYEGEQPVVEIDSTSRVLGDLRIDSRAELIVDGSVGGAVERITP